jgi:hypothetical protein
MRLLPGMRPLKVPVVELIAAIAAEPEIHVPPADALDSGIVSPAHTIDGPVIGRGKLFTVTTV